MIDLKLVKQYSVVVWNEVLICMHVSVISESKSRLIEIIYTLKTKSKFIRRIGFPYKTNMLKFLSQNKLFWFS